ncbi:MAG: aspartate-semialdehyde dehydrogenase [bacterium]|nr:aspartate-semialdehyde dehydrogenase [bacterium]
MKPNPRHRDERIPVAVLGATGSVGQRFAALLADHPWFRVAVLAASERSVGRPYRQAVRWVQPAPIPEALADMPIVPCEPQAASGCRLAFSSLDDNVAGELESEFAAAGFLVVSNAKNHRMHPLVPLLVPEINAEHLDLAERQEFGAGRILTNPNCSTIGLVLALKPLVDAFGVDQAHVVTMQALSGAGVPGVPGMQVPDNIIPLISGEEEKIESESRKILGSLGAEGIDGYDLSVSAQCNRVAVSDGHTGCVSVKLGREASEEELIDAWRGFEGEPQRLGLPSAPTPPIHYLEEPDAPQPRLHRDLGAGMAISVGRLRPCPLLDYKFVTLSHNTVRGAAGGAVLVAELAVERGWLEGETSGAG